MNIEMLWKQMKITKKNGYILWTFEEIVLEVKGLDFLGRRHIDNFQKFNVLFMSILFFSDAE